MRVLCFAVALAVTASAAEIETREVIHEAGTATANGFFAAPGRAGPFPGVMVVHDWWGLDDYARSRARLLAGLGYVALAVDLYGDGKSTEDPRKAFAHMSEIRNNTPELHARFTDAMRFLQNHPKSDRDKIAAVGYGFGGNVVLQMARNGLPGLDGAAGFYATLELREPNPPVHKITARILVCHGGGDPFVKPESVETFKRTMQELGADLRFVSYKDALHGFSNPSATRLGKSYGIPLKYDGPAERASHDELDKFLRRLWDHAGPAASKVPD